MTIRKKLSLGFFASALLVALVGTASIYSLASTARRLRQVVDTSLREVQETNQEADAAVNVHSETDNFQNAIDDNRRADAQAAYMRVQAAFDRLPAPVEELRQEAHAKLALARTASEIAEEKDKLLQLDGFDAITRHWKDMWLVASAAALQQDKSNQHLFTPCDDAAHDIWAASLALEKGATRETADILIQSADNAHTQWLVILGASAAALGLTAAIACLIAGPLSRRLSNVRSKAAQLGAGDVSARITLTGEDEITALAETFNHMAASLASSREELVQTAHRALAASHSKSAFLANMSHEIRTPMTAIMGYSELLLDPLQPPSERQESLQIIRRNSRHLLELINDVLDLSKIEADKMTIERIPMDLPQLTADVVSQMHPAIAKGLQFRLSFGETLPESIRSDPTRLKQILMNILGNAIKFTEHGEVRLHVSCRPAGDSNTIIFDITDTGIGMTPEQIARIFQPFTQADDSMTRRFGGSGLGLAISKSLAEMLGGGLAAGSLPGVGSKFQIAIDAGPLDPAETLHGLTESMLGPIVAEQPTAKKITLVGRILLAEDGPDNQRLISLHLRKAGAHVTIAENGRIAVDLATSQPFDLILMDMQMPDLDGYGATSELRSRGCQLPIIALTAHAMADDRAKCLAAGCSDYLTKPIGRDLLLSALAPHLPGSTMIGGTPAGGPIAPEPAFTGHRSSLADDPDMHEALAEFIADLPPRVAEMSSLLAQHKLAELQRLVHQLKGAGGGYGFARITELAASAEKVIRQDGTVEQLQSGLDALIALVRSVEGYQPAREQIHAQ